MLFFAIVIDLLLLHFRKFLGNLHFHIGNGIIIYQIPVFPIGCQRNRCILAVLLQGFADGRGI